MLVFNATNAQIDPWLVCRRSSGRPSGIARWSRFNRSTWHPYFGGPRWSLRLRSCTAARVPHLVAGGFKKDLEALNDLTPHDERYARLVEYATVIQSLLGTSDPVSFEGATTRSQTSKLTPALRPACNRAC